MTIPTLCFVAGFNEGALLGDGWYARTRDGRCGVAMRPAAPHAELRVTLPATDIAWRLGLLLCGAPSLLGRPVTVRLAACLAPADSDGDERWRDLAAWRLATDVWTWREATLAAATSAPDPAPAILYLRLESAPAFVPARHLGNDDHRPMGINWAALRVWPLTPHAHAHAPAAGPVARK